MQPLGFVHILRNNFPELTDGFLRPEVTTVGCGHRNPYSRPEAATVHCALREQGTVAAYGRE